MSGVRRWIGVPCVALMAVLVGAGVGMAQVGDGEGAILGRVVERGGVGVGAVVVRVQAGERVVGSAVTDRAGRYRVAGVRAGAYVVRAEALGYGVEERRVVVGAGDEVEVDLALVAAPVELEGLTVVSAARMATAVGGVTVVGREDVERGAAVSQSVGEILGKSVPGLAVGTQSMSNHGQTLRGRGVVVLIDGVPQSTLRNVSRDFATIDPSVIERVEVMRGATAIYGDGATGGVINIITRRPGVGAAAFRTEAGATGSLTVPGAGLGVRLTQAVQGSVGAMDYVASGTFGQTGSYYDAEGDLIPADPHGQGGVADTRSWDLFAKAGYSRGTRRVQLSANLYRSDQDTEHTADISVNTLPPGTSKARALRGLREWEPQGTRNLNVSVDYSDGGFLGGRLHAQAWGRDYVTRFRGFDRRVIRNGEWLSGHVGQSFVDSEKWGGRLEVEQPLRLAEGTLLLGADYTLENTAQLMTIMDPAVYDGSGGLVFEKVGERVWVPALRPHDLGLFAQIGWQVSGRLLTRAGVRWERIRMRVDDFTTIDDARVTGGNVAYDPVLFNAGAVFEATGWLDVFASFAQGFSLADVGRILRGASDGFAVRNSTLEAPRVDHLEAGVRGEWGGSVRGSLAVFRSESELGTRLVADALGVLRVERAPERIYGVEAALDARRGSWAFGGTVSWTEGEYREGRTGAWLPFDGYRIQPLKATGYLGHATAGGWTNRLQALYSGSRDRVWRELGRPDRTTLGYGQWPVERHAVVDFRSRRPLGPGHLEVGIENLLNRRYFDVLSQLDLSEGNAYHTAGRGRTLSVGYAVAY